MSTPDKQLDIFDEFAEPGSAELAAPAPKGQGLAAPGYSENTIRIRKIRYTHAAMIDVILANPAITQNELCEMFGVSVAWMSCVMGSDAFQTKLAERRSEIIDPEIILAFRDKLQGAADLSVTRVLEKLESSPKDSKFALEALKITTTALGFGARPTATVSVQNSFVVEAPGQRASAEDWAAAHRNPIDAE